jgi:DNA polymerase-1
LTAKLFVIDGYSYLYQAYHAIRNMTGPRGESTNAIYGFINMVLRIRDKETPDYIAVAFDLKEPSFRHKAFKEYKATRKPMPEDLRQQIPVVREIVNAYRIPVFSKAGFEADDVIATIAEKVRDQDVEVFIISRDKDMKQVLRPRVHLYNTKDGKTYGLADFREEYGFEPEQLPDYLALMGDSSDNIPGVPGIGKKTALTLMKRFDTLDKLYSELDQVEKKSVRTRLEQNRENAEFSKMLATVRRDVPVDFHLDRCRVGEPDAETLIRVFQKHGFKKFLSLLLESSHNAREWKRRPHKYHLVNTPNALSDLAGKLAEQEIISFDTETTSEDPHAAELVGVSFSWKETQAYYVPVKGPEGAQVLPKADVLELLRPVLESEKILKTGHNLKYDVIVLAYEGIQVRGTDFDTMIAAYLINPAGRGYSLDSLSLEFLGHRNIPLEDLIGKGRGQTTIDTVELGRVSDYACEDADMTLRLRNVLLGRLADMELEELLREVEMPLVPVLVELEMNGVTIDVGFLKEFSARLGSQLEEIKAKIYEMAGDEFNINSPKQLGEVLFGRLELPVIRKTPTGHPATGHDILEELASEHELPALIVDYRSLAKLKNTYVDALPRMVSPQTGRIHTSFNQTATTTGRLSSSSPNLQNIPVRGELGRQIRKAFIPRKSGRKMLTADYSQIELRLLAHYSRDEKLVAVFANDGDIHATVAAEIFGARLPEVTPEQRGIAKTVNFATLYGQGPHSLSRKLRIPFNQAKEFIDSYFEKYPGLRAFIDKTVEDAQKTGYVTTVFNRRRYIPGIASENSQLRSQARRLAVNTILQGSAADMIKVAMVRIAQKVREEKKDALMLLQIHDELVFDTAADEVPGLTELVREEMACAIPLSVPVKINVGVGDNWLEAK